MAAPSASSPGFLGSIFTNPFWLGGLVCQIGGWVLQAAALDRGELFLVQPIISLQVVIALPFGIWLTHQRVGRREWLGAAAVIVGLTVYLGVSNPAAGRSNGPAETWIIAGAVVVAIAAVFALLGAHQRPAAKAALFGTAGGVLFGFQAAVTKVFVGVIPDGIGAILSSWTTYALILSAVIGFYFTQVSLQAGVLAPAIATTNVANPATSVILGRIVFDEVPQRSTGGKIASLVALALMLVGLLAVSRGEAAGQAGGPAPGTAATG